MPKLSDLKRARALWVDHFGSHPAIVLVESATSPVVICGTSKQKSDPDEVRIDPASPAGYVLGLNSPTFFYWWKMAIVSSEASIKSVKGMCPPGVFHSLERLAVLAATKIKNQQIQSALKVLAPIAAMPAVQPVAASPVMRAPVPTGNRGSGTPED
jgi:hypothetical protein